MLRVITHNDTHTLGGTPWTSDRLIAEGPTYTINTREKHPCRGEIRTRDPSKRAATVLHFRPRGSWEWLSLMRDTKSVVKRAVHRCNWMALKEVPEAAASVWLCGNWTTRYLQGAVLQFDTINVIGQGLQHQLWQNYVFRTHAYIMLWTCRSSVTSQALFMAEVAFFANCQSARLTRIM